MADAMGMRVLGFDPCASQLRAYISPATLQTLWRDPDALLLHCPLTAR